jgi:diguanylate cyclase (GGDEF)-like protein/PAS domain S-box-containing protein
MNSQFLENNLFLNAFQYAPSGIALVALNGTWLKVNPSFCKLLGYEEAELLTKSFQEITYSSDLEADLDFMRQMIHKEIESYQMEKRYIQKEGQLITALLSVSLVYNEDGSPKYFISQVLDITANRNAQNEINQLRDRMVDILESITDAFFSIDNQFRFVYVNQEAEMLFHKKILELQGNLIWEEFPRLIGTDFQSNCSHALANKVKMKFEQYIPSIDNAVGKWFEALLYPTTEGLSVYFQDVTDRKLTEQKLVESEQWFRLLADYSTDMISRHTMEGHFIYVSPICFTLLGYKPEELLGKMAYDYFHPDDILQIRSNHLEITISPEIQTVSYRMLKKDGSYTWFETTSRTIRVPNINAIEIISVSRDITKRKTTEIKMNEDNELLMKLSMTDGLTGIANRRAFDVALEREWKVTARLGQPFSLLLCDIDFFKDYNDTYGHLAGDACLQRVANTLKKALNRPNDFTARFGGEEFAIILPNTSKEGALQVSDLLRNMIHDLQIPHLSSKLIDDGILTVSIGLASFIPSTLLSANILIEHADKALYKAKMHGRNRVEVYEV